MVDHGVVAFSVETVIYTRTLAHSCWECIDAQNPFFFLENTLQLCVSRKPSLTRIGTDTEIRLYHSTHCNTLQHTATRCSTLQRTASHCSTLQRTASHCSTLQRTASHCSALQHKAHAKTNTPWRRHCNTRPIEHILQHAPTRHGTDVETRHSHSRANITHCNTLQHTATQSSCQHQHAMARTLQQNTDRTHSATRSNTPWH